MGTPRITFGTKGSHPAVFTCADYNKDSTDRFSLTFHKAPKFPEAGHLPQLQAEGRKKLGKTNTTYWILVRWPFSSHVIADLTLLN